MGCFSFIKMDTRTNIQMGDIAHLLCPNDDVMTGRYDGYGRLNDVDVYAILAIWNRQIVLSDVDKFVYNDWVKRNVNVDSESMKYYLDSNNSDNDVMSQILELADDIRIIGIDLFFKHKEELAYPLKFVDDTTLSYDDVEASVDDPAQGFVHYHLDNGYDQIKDEIWGDDDDEVTTCRRCGREVSLYDCFYDEQSGEPICNHCYDDLYC